MLKVNLGFANADIRSVGVPMAATAHLEFVDNKALQIYVARI